MNLTKLQQVLGYTFKDENLLKRALTLSSYDTDCNNQQLEFFGDAILEFVVSEMIFSFSESEGKLTERRKCLVSDKSLKPVSEKLNLKDYLYKGDGDTNNKKAIPSSYEAVVAAIYLDGGIEEVKKFVAATLDFSASPDTNFKGKLQEYLQGNGEKAPEYKLCRDVGTPQKHRFEVSVTVHGKTYFGYGASKKSAEQQAAKEALNILSE